MVVVVVDADGYCLTNSFLDDIDRITAKMYFPTDGECFLSVAAVLVSARAYIERD